MKTKKILHPVSNDLIEERDFRFLGLKLIAIRKYEYNDKGQLVEINHYVRSDELVKTQKYSYNTRNQLYFEATKFIYKKGESKSYYLYNDLGQVIKVLGELENGHQYLHEFSYTVNGDRINELMATLVPDSTLKEKYERLLL